MKTAKDARIWILRDVVAYSLRKRARTISAKDIPGDATAATVERVKREMERLADEFAARADRLKGERSERSAQAGLASGDPADLSGEFDK